MGDLPLDTDTHCGSAPDTISGLSSPVGCYVMYYCPVRCLYVELNAEFEEMLKRNDDARKEAINRLNAQTAQPMVDID